jgi:5-methylcytosine-specific restriction endonuclease McrA
MKIFRYGKRHGGIRKAYLRWRAAQNPPMPYQCDTPGCVAMQGLEMHHRNGANRDNRLKNLQLLCRACHQETVNYGRRNRGMVNQQSGGFSIVRRDGSGKRDYELPTEPGNYRIT